MRRPIRLLLPAIFQGRPPCPQRLIGTITDDDWRRGVADACWLFLPLTEHDVEQLRSTWLDVQDTFSALEGQPLLPTESPEEWYGVRLDVSDVLQQIDERELIEPSYPDGFGNSAWIDIDVHPLYAPDSELTSLPLVQRFVEQLWLALNIAHPASLELEQSVYAEPNDVAVPPALSASGFLEAFQGAQRDGWPPLRTIPFRSTWDWLHGEMIHDVCVANTPLQVALFSLLQLSRRDPFDPANILSISQALEAIVATGKENIGSTFRTRVQTILGDPSTRKSRLTNFYDLRSRIVHGDYPLVRLTDGYVPPVRPEIGRWIKEVNTATRDGLALLLALLQDLAANNAHGYEFSQTMQRRKGSLIDES